MRVLGRPDQFFIHELSNSKLGQFATKAGVFYSAKRQVRSGPGCLIDEDHARVDLACDPLSVFYIFGNHCSAKAVRRVICQLDRFILVLHAENERYWSEKLLVIGWIFGVDVS
jgi:hypothetical protein